MENVMHVCLDLFILTASEASAHTERIEGRLYIPRKQEADFVYLGNRKKSTFVYMYVQKVKWRSTKDPLEVYEKSNQKETVRGPVRWLLG